jgi:hypothetical protein
MVTNDCVLNTKDKEEIEKVKVTVLVIPVLTHLTDASITITHVLL